MGVKQQPQTQKTVSDINPSPAKPIVRPRAAGDEHNSDIIKATIESISAGLMSANRLVSK